MNEARCLAVVCLLALAESGVVHARIPLAIRGSVVVHLRPDSDTLTVRIEKRDLNIYDGEDVLLAQLFAPDRTPLVNAIIPDDGNPKRGGGRPQDIQVKELSAKVESPGVYRLHLRPKSGSDLVFGFKTNCPHYVIQGPIFLNDYSLGGDVFFAPPKGEFKITAEAVHKPGRQKLPLYDGQGEVVHTFDLVKVMQPVSFVVPADRPRGEKPWRIHVTRQDVRITVQGLEYWTNSAESHFSVGKAKWLLTPYSKRVRLMPGQSAQLTFSVTNSSKRAAKFAISARAPKDVALRIVSPKTPVTLRPRQATDVRARVEVPPNARMGGRATGFITAAYADDPATAASATIRIEVGRPLVNRVLDMPIVLRPYQHENAQFAYLPQYPCNPPFFDRSNRPFIRTRGSDRNVSTGIQTLAKGQWIEKSFIQAVKAKYPGFIRTERAAGWYGTKIAFDGDGCAYTLLRLALPNRKRPNVLLFSPDGFDTFHVCEFPRGEFDVEQWTGHNDLPGPPPIVLYQKTANHPARWATVNDLKLLLPTRNDGKLSLGEPVLVSRKCVGPCRHSGAPSPTVTRDGRTHIVWGEVDDSGAPGVPTYAAAYDHRERKAGRKVFLAHGPPVNDVHNAPGICMDSEGYLHAITGAHGRPFRYVRSLKPNDVYSGWTKPVDVLARGFIDKKTGQQMGRQTYLALLCDSKDTLHIAFRQWRAGVDDHHGGANYAALSYQRKKKGRPWENARPLVVAALPGYSVYYHKMTLDRRDRLYLSYSYYTQDANYQNDLPGQYNHRAVITSSDGGDHWKLAETADFEAGMQAAAPKE